MENTRSAAAGWFYERAELHGTELWATGASLDHSSVPKGFYCYDLYSTGEKKAEDVSDILIARNPVANANEGAVLTREPLPFHEKDSISMRGINLFEDEYLQPLSHITEQAEQLNAPQQENGIQMSEL